MYVIAVRNEDRRKGAGQLYICHDFYGPFATKEETIAARDKLEQQHSEFEWAVIELKKVE